MKTNLNPSPFQGVLCPVRLFSCLVLVGLLAASAAAQSASSNQQWTLAERSVSAPLAASEEIRSAIAATPAPNVDQRRNAPAMTTAQWLGMQQGSSQASLEEMSKQFQVTIEPGEIDGVAVFRVKPAKMAAEHQGQLFLHLHGGGYVLGGGNSAVSEAAVISGGLGVEAVSVDYRMPPEHPFPAAVDDAVAVYRNLLGSRPAEKIFVGGTSAGGGLSLALVHQIRALKLDPPGAVWAGTPWADLTKTGDTLFTNEGLDRVLVTYDGLLGSMAKLYAGDHDMKDPLLSPVYGDFEGFPPTQFVTGTRDMFLSDTVRTHRKLRAAGVTTDLNVYEGLSHAEYWMVPGSPEEQQVLADLKVFLEQHLP